MEKGRFLTASDNEKYENFAVLAAETAEKLFPYEDPLGQAIKLGSDYYTVVGVTRRARQLGGNRRQLGRTGLQQGRVHSA